MIAPSPLSMDSSSPSSLKRQRDHPSLSSRQDDFNRLSSSDRNLRQPWNHLHRHGFFDGSMPTLSRLDKARSFAKKEAEARNGSTKSGSFAEKRSEAGSRERGVLRERRESMQGSSTPHAPRKLGHGKFLKQNTDEKHDRVLKSAEDDARKGSFKSPFRDENLKRARSYSMVYPGNDASTALGSDADRSLSKRRVLAHGDTSLEQSRISTEKDGFKRIIKFKTKHVSGVEISDASKDSNFRGIREKWDKQLACSPSKSNNGSSDELSRKSSSSARACRVPKSSSELTATDRPVAESPPFFLHVTRRARSERRRDDFCKSHPSKAVSLDGFCAELEEALLKKQEAEVNSEEPPVIETKNGRVGIAANTPQSNNSAVNSADLCDTHKVALLEEAEEREEGELEPEDEIAEKKSSKGGNKVEVFEMHVDRTDHACDDGKNSKGCNEPVDCQAQLLSEPSRHIIKISAAEFEMHEEKIRQDCDGMENQKGCKEAFGHSQLQSESSSKDALEVVKSEDVPMSDIIEKVEEQKKGVDRFCEQVCDAGREDKMDLPAMDLNSPKLNHSDSSLLAQRTATNAHARGDGLLNIDDSSLLVEEPAPQRQRTHESVESHGLLNKSHIIHEKHIRDSHTQTEGRDNRGDPTLHIEELDEFSVYGHKQKKLKVESLRLSLALPECPSGSSKFLPRPVAHEVSRTQVLRHAQSLSHLRTESVSNILTTSLSLSSFVHNPSCSLNCISLEDQEFSCGGSRQIFQGRGANSGGERLADVQKSVSSLLTNTRTECKHVPPVYQEVLQDGKLLGSGAGLPSHIAGAIGYESAKSNHQFASGDRNFAVQERGGHLNCNEAPSFVPKASSERSRGLEVKSVSNVKIGLLEISTEPIAAMAQKLQELPDSILEGLKGLVKDLLGSFAKREEFLALQQIIRSRTDLTEEILLRAHPTQLEILVSLKTGMQSFVQQGTKSLTYKALIEIFFQTRCQNVDCQQLLPVDGCECKVCSEKKGFCHECMCMVCSKFDSDSNTSRWVGCDVCMHWCHTDCGIRMSHIKPTLVTRNGIEFSEMQFQCLSCDHYMELYGFVKVVFESFASTWGAETLAKELDCVRRIFHGSGDGRGIKIRWKAEEMLQMLERNASIHDVCNSMLRFFREDGTQSIPLPLQTMQPSETADHMECTNRVSATMGSLVDRKLSSPVQDKELEKTETERADNVRNKDGKVWGSQDLHNIIGAKLTDVLMYQAKADVAREDAINLQQIISLKEKKMAEDYSLKLAKLRLDEAEEKQRQRFEELQALERSHNDYEIMKLRIETDMKHLMMKIVERSRTQLA